MHISFKFTLFQNSIINSRGMHKPVAFAATLGIYFILASDIFCSTPLGCVVDDNNYDILYMGVCIIARYQYCTSPLHLLSSQVRCCCYWPDTKSSQEYGKYEVYTASEHKDRISISRVFRLRNNMVRSVAVTLSRL